MLLATRLVCAASLYHFKVPVAQVADKVELLPTQIVAGLAAAAVGAVGNAVTATVTGVVELLQVLLIQTP